MNSSEDDKEKAAEDDLRKAVDDMKKKDATEDHGDMPVDPALGHPDKLGGIQRNLSRPTTTKTRRVPMVELRSLGQEDEAPPGDSWVLVEPHGGLYYITGKQNAASIDASVAPEPFDSPETAMRAATESADLLSVPYLFYIRQE